VLQARAKHTSATDIPQDKYVGASARLTRRVRVAFMSREPRPCFSARRGVPERAAERAKELFEKCCFDH
jgi:hypothetical protein